MSEMEPWTRQLLSVIVSQLCKTIGWHSVSSSSLQILVDVLHRYLKQLGTTVHDYSEHYNHTFPGLEELFLAFSDMGINVEDLKEYADYVAPIPIKEKVPKYPLEKKSNLNFLKPGSREVVTRPVHIHEHLPAMYPEMSDDYPSRDAVCNENSSLPSLSASSSAAAVAAASSASMPFVKPGEKEAAIDKRITRLISEEIGRPLRELSSVMMTTSGFLSPAREGKAPEARVPKLPSNVVANHNNVHSSQPPSSYPAVPPEVKGEHKKHSHSKSSKTADRKSRDEMHNGRDRDRERDDLDDSKVKKLASMKELSKLKAFKPLLNKSNDSLPEATTVGRPPKSEKVKIPPPLTSPKEPKITKPKAEKVEKLTTLEEPEMVVEKLTTEPNKQKLNIFKRFTKVKEDRAESPVSHKNNHHHHHHNLHNQQSHHQRQQEQQQQLKQQQQLQHQQQQQQQSPPHSQHQQQFQPDKDDQINECIEAVIKRSRERDDVVVEHSTSRIKDEMVDGGSGDGAIFEPSSGVPSTFFPGMLPPQTAAASASTANANATATAIATTTTSTGKHTKRKKKQKFHETQPSKKQKLNHESSASATMASSSTTHPNMSVPRASPIEFEKPKPVMEPEPPPYSFFQHLQSTPGFMPPSLQSNLLIPRFGFPFMNLTKGDLNGPPHPEMPNLPLPPATLMQPAAFDSNHKFSSSSATLGGGSGGGGGSATAPLSTVTGSKKSSTMLSPVAGSSFDFERKGERNSIAAAAAAILSDKKLKKKMKKDKREKDKKKREKKEKLKDKEKLKLEKKKELKKLKGKKDKLKKKNKSTASLSKKEEQQLLKQQQKQQLQQQQQQQLQQQHHQAQINDEVSALPSSSVPKLKLKISSGNSPQLSPNAVGGGGGSSAGGVQSPKIVIKPVLKPEETSNTTAATSAASSSSSSSTSGATGRDSTDAAAPSATVVQQHHRNERERTSSPELAKIAYISKPTKQKSGGGGSSSSSKGSAHHNSANSSGGGGGGGAAGTTTAASAASSSAAAAASSNVSSTNHHHGKSNVAAVEHTVAPITLSTKSSKKNASINAEGSGGSSGSGKSKNKEKKSKKSSAASVSGGDTSGGSAAAAAAATAAAAPAKAKPAAFYYDADGNQVWVCPTCGAQDDGTPMIGCDGCDAWYHWVCVGIKSPPDAAKWFCGSCANS